MGRNSRACVQVFPMQPRSLDLVRNNTLTIFNQLMVLPSIIITSFLALLVAFYKVHTVVPGGLVEPPETPDLCLASIGLEGSQYWPLRHDDMTMWLHAASLSVGSRLGLRERITTLP